MKKHSLFAEICIFCFISLVCIIPPFLVQIENTSTDSFSQWTFPVFYIPNLFIALVLVFFYYESTKKLHFLYEILLPSTKILCVLFFFSLIFKFLSCFITSDVFVSELTVTTPSNLKEWIFCICQFLFAALYEEVIYRMYYPQALNNFIPEEKQNKLIKQLLEIAVLIIFALSHFYLGIFAVINAGIAHYILRKTYRKTNSVLPGFIAHFFYNMISLILL